MKKYSSLVDGKTFAGIIVGIAIMSVVFIYPETTGFQASLLGGDAINTFISDKLPFLHNLIRLLIFLLICSGISIILMTMLLKIEARQNFNHHKKEKDFWDIVTNIPSVAIIEIMVFIWVLGWLLLALLLIVDIFGGNLNLLIEVSNTDTEILFRFSLVFGLLGGCLSSIKFFVPSSRALKVFHVGYVFKYLANPFFSCVIGFLSFLLFMNLQWFGLNDYTNKKINVIAVVFFFTMVGYFSEMFISVLYALVKKFTEWLEDSFNLELRKLKEK